MNEMSHRRPPDHRSLCGRTARQRFRVGGAEAALLVASVVTAGLVVLIAYHEDLPPQPERDTVVAVRRTKRLPPVMRRADLRGRRLLLVHSYHPSYPWVETITQGVRSAIEGTGLDLSVFFMDAKRHTDTAWKTASGRRAIKWVEQYRPDVVIAADDDAQRYFAMHYVNTRLPIVFTGVDADPSMYGYPARNVTGIIERPHFKQSVALAQRLLPIRRIGVLSCHDTTSILALGFMRQEPLDVEVAEWLIVDDFNDWKKAVTRFNHSVDAIVIRSYQALKQPGSGDNVAPEKVAAWTSQNATIPTIAFHDFEVGDGLLLGVVKSGQEYGSKAAEYAIRILEGTRPSALPILKPKQGIPMINRVTARHLGISWEGETLSDLIAVPND